MSDVRPFATADDVADAAVFLFVTLAAKAIAERGEFFCSLAGGTTPLAGYRILAAPMISSKVNWERTHVFWGDERCVPEGDKGRNDEAALDALLRKVPIPSKNIHRVPATEPDGAQRYESELRRVFSSSFRESPSSSEIPRFDLILLGLGQDGHTASLFPGHPAVEEKTRLVVRVDGAPKPPPSRVTFTLPLINAARHVAFLVTGKDKNAALRRVLNGDPSLPAARVAPVDGTLAFLSDAAALTGEEAPS
ncbi:MAG TPA: 6-phosphogluconolactonase [Thermoanaerobaculia bacterium]|nr:6-phosphogluconolactonase [Thermoanaerobaculia bacterium]